MTSGRTSPIARAFAAALLAGVLILGARADEPEFQLPVPIDSPRPIYPEAVTTGRVDGIVLSYLWVTDEGGVSAAIVVSSPDERLNGPTLAALRVWTFEPAVHNGVAVSAVCSIPIEIGKEGVAVGAIARPESFETNPRIVNRVVPRYSASLIKAGQPEQVITHLFIDEKGRVMEAGIGKSSNRNLDAPSIVAARQWRFVPARLNGKPVVSWTAAPINYEQNSAVNPTAPPEKSVLPKLKQSFPAVYPYDLAISDKAGSAAVSVFIGRDGAVLKTNILSATELEFGIALAAAIETWTFEPGSTNGRPVRVTMTQRQDFRARKPGSSIDKETAELAARIRSGKFKPARGQDLDAPVRVQTEVMPVFPTALLERQREGTAAIEVVVDKKGRAVLPRIVEASEPEFGWAAATAAQRWLFEPPTVKGNPVEVIVAIPFKFNPPEP